jgi:YD repeat-containing protein
MSAPQITMTSNGYIDDFRLTMGAARYVKTYAPRRAAFPDSGLPPGADPTPYNVQATKNAAGQITQFTRYDALGQVLQTIDPKGVTTDITYTPRGWVSTITTTAPGAPPRVTSYGYDNVGQRTQVSQPDGTRMNYSYDATHRLVGVTDTRGNSVTYTLDSTGNRTAEEVRDATGVLQRSINRSFDALNRLQQVTGAGM